MPIVVTAVAVLTAMLCYAPRFLTYATNYAQVDAVIVLLGPDFSARQMHAKNLVDKRMANYLIIPAFDKTYRVEQGTMKILNGDPNNKSIHKNDKRVMPKFYEDTHLELMKAKVIMNFYGQKSAIFVSSPYHMRRIQIIVDKEFDSFSKLYFSPTPFEKAPVEIWQLKASDWKKVWKEYIKILWFMVYFPWTK